VSPYIAAPVQEPLRHPHLRERDSAVPPDPRRLYPGRPSGAWKRL